MTNVHDDHVVSCLCCAILDIDYDADLSDLTPGVGFNMRCMENHFYISEDDAWKTYYSKSEKKKVRATFHILNRGATCKDFVPIE